MTTAVREKPILFSGDMVRAILDGRKTMTRRVVKPQPTFDGYWWTHKGYSANGEQQFREGMPFFGGCPYGVTGDRLWIKTGYQTRYHADRNETFWSVDSVGFITTHGRALSKSGKAKRDGNHPGMFMPYWLSQELRLPVLEITDVRVERVKEISEVDAEAEGALTLSNRLMQDAARSAAARGQKSCGCVDYFRELWNEINAKRGFGWDANPWTWVIAFEVLPTPTGTVASSDVPA